MCNLARQLGGSCGSAVAATLITRFTEQGRQALLPHLTSFDPAASSWLDNTTRAMLRQGGSLAQAQTKAYARLEFVLKRQASMLAFEKVFLVMGITFICGLPLLLLFRTGRASGGVGAH